MSTTTIYPTVDAYVDSSAPTSNFGSNVEICVVYNDSGGKGGAGDIHQSYLYHDLSAIGIAWNEVDSAYIHAYCDVGGGYPEFGKRWHRCIDTWVESTITYNNQPTNFGSEVSDVLYLANNDPSLPWWKWTITDLVKDALQNRSGILNMRLEYYGFKGGVLNQNWYYSSDQGSAVPYIVINYTLGGVAKTRAFGIIY